MINQIYVVRVSHKQYKDDQPRVPKGDPRGGQWTRVGGQTISPDPERAPWLLTEEQWNSHVASRANFPGLPPHIPDWHEEEGLLPGRLDLNFVPIKDATMFSDAVWASDVGSPPTPNTTDVTLDLTHPDFPENKNIRSYRVDATLGRLVAGKNEIGWPDAEFVLTDDRYQSDQPSIFSGFDTDPTGIWRGMVGEELEQALDRGYIQSNAKLTFSDQGKLTYFSDEPGMALSYASSFAPWTHKPTFETPSYVVRVNRPPKDQININPRLPREIAVKSVPTSEITEIWEIRLAAERPGRMRAGVSRSQRLEYNFDESAEQFLVYRKVPEAEWKNIIPYYRRMRPTVNG